MTAEPIIKQLVILASFYLCYHLALRATTFHHLKRAFLLATLIAGTLPFLGLPSFNTALPITKELTTIVLKPVEIISVDLTPGSSLILWQVYLAGVLLFAGFLLIKLVRFLLLFLSSKPSGYKNVRLIDEHQAPCSFLFWSFLPENIGDGLKEQVLAHEYEHIRQKHSLDILLCEILKVVFWFNPIIHFIKIELIQIHEFLADEKSNAQFDSYVDGMLAFVKWKNAGLLASSINPQFVQLKKRINMLHQKPSGQLKKMLFLLAAPLLFSAVFITACEEQPEKQALDVINPVDMKEIDEMAEYPGGMEAMATWMGEEIKYPAEDKDSESEGTVMVQFIISADGSIQNVKHLDTKVSTGFNGETAPVPTEAMIKEAIRAIESMPSWKPATKDGQSVPVQLTLPVKFKLK